MKNSKPNGVHYLLGFFGCDGKQINSEKFWKKTVVDSVKGTKIKILHKYFYNFNPYGITGFLLLSSSHMSIHTWPEYDYAACDVFSCSTDGETKKIIKYLEKNIAHKRIKTKKINRGYIIRC